MTPPAERSPAGLALRVSFALGLGALLLSFVGGFAYLSAVRGGLALQTDALAGARDYAARGNLAGAVREMRAYLRITRTEGAGLTELGQLLLETGQLEPAASAFDAALRRDGRDARAFAGLAAVRHAEGRDAEATALLENAVRLSPGDERYARALAESRARAEAR